jgi:hypothetical protein
MFGAHCIGVTGRLSDLLRFVGACRRIADQFGLPGDDLVDAPARTVRADNLGSDQIYYLPRHNAGRTTDPAQP